MTTRDELESAYTARDEASGTVRKIAAENLGLEAATEKAKASLHGLGLALAGALGIASVSAFGSSIFRASAEMEGMSLRLLAITRSADVAGQKLDFIRRLAAPSVFEFGDLAQAGVELEAFGLNLQRILPTVSILGTMFDDSAAGLMELVRAFGMLRAGRGGEAMESLSRFGITRDQLKDMGIQFAKSGELLSSWQDTMAAIETLTYQKFGDIANIMANTPQAKLASLMDAWHQMLASIGQGLSPFLSRLFGGLGDTLMNLVNSGVFARLGEIIGQKLASVDWIGLMKEGIAGVAAAFMTLPEIVRGVREALTDDLHNIATFAGNIGATILNVFTAMGDGIKAVFQSAVTDARNALSAVGKGLAMLSPGSILEAFKAHGLAGVEGLFGQALGTVIATGAPGTPDVVAQQLANIGQAMQGLAPPPWFANTRQALGGAGATYSGAFADVMGMLNGNGEPQGQAPLPEGPFGYGDTLQQIEQNTRKTADAFDDWIKRSVYGGGPLGRMGVTPDELTGGRAAARDAQRERRIEEGIYRQSLSVLERVTRAKAFAQ